MSIFWTSDCLKSSNISVIQVLLWLCVSFNWKHGVIRPECWVIWYKRPHPSLRCTILRAGNWRFAFNFQEGSDSHQTCFKNDLFTNMPSITLQLAFILITGPSSGSGSECQFCWVPCLFELMFLVEANPSENADFQGNLSRTWCK